MQPTDDNSAAKPLLVRIAWAAVFALAGVSLVASIFTAGMQLYSGS